MISHTQWPCKYYGCRQPHYEAAGHGRRDRLPAEACRVARVQRLWRAATDRDVGMARTTARSAQRRARRRHRIPPNAARSRRMRPSWPSRLRPRIMRMAHACRSSISSHLGVGVSRWTLLLRLAPWIFGGLLAAVFAAVSVLSLHRGDSAAQPQDPVVARGEYLVRNVAACARCHGDDLSGGKAFNGTFIQLDTNNLSVGVQGVIHAPNLTPDAVTGLGSWTDQQVIDVFREGVDKAGQPLQGPMPLSMFSGMSDEDINAIVAYLRSLTPVTHDVPQNRITGTIGDKGAPQCMHCHQSQSILVGTPHDQAILQSRGLYLVNYAAA